MIKKYILTFTTSLLVSLPLYANLNLELPEIHELGGGSRSAFTAHDNEIGLKLLRKMRRQLPVVEDPELNHWLIDLGNKLARNSGATGKLYFLLIKNSNVNAAAYDGGVILINTGLILHTESESELAAVIAHEIAHVTQNHLARMRSGSKGGALGTGAAVLAGIAIGSQSPDAGSAIITSAMAAQQHQQLSFTRSMESEADREGIRILSKSGFKASGMPSFLEKLERLTDNPHAQLMKYLQSHPLSIERVSDTRSQARQLGDSGSENISYYYAREKVRALMSSGLQSRIPTIKKPSIKNYSIAMQHFNNGQLNQAESLIQHGKQSAEIIALAQIQNDRGEYQKTVDLLSKQVATKPGDVALLLPLTSALLGLGKVKDAWQRLRYVVPSEQTSLRFFEIKQEVASKLGYQADAYLAAAERNVRIGEYRHAIIQLKQASKLPKLNGNDAARIRAKLKQIEARYGKS